jgi:hydrogenase-4 component F
MHTWLPDAYSEAPAPIAAMLAGVLETVAVYTVLRSKALVDQALPPEFTGNLLLTFGLLSFIVASLFILIQHNYKRLFAYSSIEHMGLAMIGFGVGGMIGTFGGLFHLLNHAVAKALAFFVAGNIHRRFDTLEIDGVRGLARAQPITAVAILVAGCALVGLPPFSPFISELLVVSAVAAQDFSSDTMHVGRFVTMTISDEMRSLGIVALFLFFAVVLFGGFMFRVGAMVWGTPPAGVAQGESWTAGHVPLMIMIVALLGLGFVLPDPIQTLLTRAVNVIVVR